MPHRNPARRARSGIDHGGAGDDDAGELVQLAEGLAVNRGGVGDGDGGPEQARHQVGRSRRGVFAPVVVEAGNRQVVAAQRRAIEEDDAFLGAHLPLLTSRSSARMRAEESSSLSPAPISAFICWAISAAPGSGVAVSCALSITMAMSLWCSLTLKPAL